MTVACSHRKGPICTLNLPQYGERPSDGICLFKCPKYDGPARGLGDVVRKVTERTKIHQAVQYVTGGCGGCQKRQDALNRMFPYRQGSQ